MEVIHPQTKSPTRRKNRVKKALRYIITLPVYIMFLHTRNMINLQKTTEKRAYKLMLKYNLLENYIR